MDLRNLLQTMLTLNEGETKETSKGREHKGTYGTSHGKEDVRDQYGHKIGKVNKDASGKKSDAPKKRGRPTKAAKDSTGADIKHDTSDIQSMLGKKPKGEVGKKSVKHSLKDWIESVESNTLNEDGQFITKPIPQQSTQLQQVIGPDGRPALNQPIPTSAALRVASALSSSNGTQGMAEDGEKWIQKAIKHPGALTKKAKAAGQSTKAFAKAHAHDKGTTGKQARLAQTLGKMHEAKDLPGKQDKLDVAPPKGKLTKADFKALGNKKKKVAEARMMEESEYTYEKIGKILSQEKPTLASDSDEFVNAVYHEMIQMGMTPRSAHNKLNYDEDFLGEVVTAYHHYLKHGIMDEEVGAGRGVINPPVVNPSAPVPPARTASPGFGSDWKPLTPDTSGSSMGSIKSGTWQSDPKGRVRAPGGDPEGVPEGVKASGFLKSLSPFSMKESKDMKDIQLENWEKELNSLLNEGITVSSSTGQQGSPDSVSINATDADAQELLAIVRQAGLGVFGGDKPQSDYGAPMHDNPEGHGTEPEMSPAVVGDDSDMLALIKKMTGIDMGGEEGSMDHGQDSDYEDEEGHDGEEGPDDTALQPAGDDESEEGSEEQDSGEESEDDVEEGNAFTGKLKQTAQGGEFKMGDKTYKDTSSIEEDDMEEGKFGSSLKNLKPLDKAVINTGAAVIGVDQAKKLAQMSKGSEPAPGAASTGSTGTSNAGAGQSSTSFSDTDPRRIDTEIEESQEAIQEDGMPGAGNKEALAKQIYDLGMEIHTNDRMYNQADPEGKAQLAKLKAQFAQQFPGEDAFKLGSAISHNEYQTRQQQNVAQAKQRPAGIMQKAKNALGGMFEDGDEMCNECGGMMYEGHTCGDEQVEEGYANETGHEEMAQLKYMLGMGNDMHRPKNSQATGNIQKVTMETKLMKQSSDLLVDFRKLSGIK